LVENYPILKSFLTLKTPAAITLFFFSVIFVTGQPVRTLQEKLKTSGSDTARVNLLINIASGFSSTDKDSSRLYLNEAIALSGELDYPFGLMRANFKMGEIFQRPREESIEYYLAALSYAKRLQRRGDESTIMNRVATHFFMLGDYLAAEDYYLKTRAIGRELGDIRSAMVASTNLGMTYTKLTDYARAFDELTLSNHIADSLGIRAHFGGNCIDIATLFTLQGKYDEAITYYDKAIETFVSESDTIMAGYATIGKSEAYMQKGDYSGAVKLLRNLHFRTEVDQQFILYQNMATSLMAMHDWKEAEQYFLKAKNHNDRVTKTPFYAAQNYLGLAKLYQQTRKYVQGLEAAHKAEVLAKQQSSPQYRKECLLVLSSLYEGAGDLNRSLVYQKRYAELQDSIARIDQSKRVAEAETKFRLGEKNRELTLLEKENELQKTRERFNRITVTVLVIALLFILVTSLVLARAYRKSRAKSDLLAAQKTEIEQASLLITEQSDKLLVADKMKSRFFANISHELRTPVTLISGMLEFMAESPIPAKEKDRVMVALGNSRKLNAIVEEMLDLTRAEAGRVILKKKSHRLQPLLSRIANMFGSLIERNQIRMILDLSSEPVYVALDEKYFEKIINNLIYNAIKFTPPGGWIRIHTVLSPEGEKATIHISDSGSGIANEDLPYIFDRFYQTTSGAQANDSKGTGIGLSLVKEFAELHGGGVFVSSQLHKGSVFSVWFPVVQHEVGEVNVQDTEPEFSWMSFERPPVILLVEDHEEMRTYIGDVLGNRFTIAQASNGVEGLQWLETNEADLIISDVMMPVMDGYAFLSTVKNDARTKHIPVIMLTARAAEEDKLHGLSMGVDDYIVKPFNTIELRIRVQNLLSNQINRKTWLLKPVEPQEQRAIANTNEKQFIDAVTDYVESHIGDSLIAVGDLASHMAVSERQLYRTCGEFTGLAPAQLIKDIRLKKAYKLLMAKEVSKVAELASRVGYDSAAYFSKQFMERFGKRPGDLL
jgi:signal transduction histidine kinase/DNA-binding response OmpR family regulator